MLYKYFYITRNRKILERRYTDALIQPARKENEYRAMATMIDRSNIEGKTIIIADRGEELYHPRNICTNDNV